jgi:NADH:ubiquinone oxidoreductase subunit 5 (subunit L)/multisubunit Na+/H+ antiporter MnhA subunit
MLFEKLLSATFLKSAHAAHAATAEATATSIVSAAVKGDVAHKVAQVGAGGALVFGLTLNEFGVVVGIVVGVLGFLVQVYYRHKEFRLKALYYAKHGVEDKHDEEPS